jgi:hypothetical protein
MTGNTIDETSDTAANPDDQASRKRRLLKGRKNFAEFALTARSRKANDSAICREKRA